MARGSITARRPPIKRRLIATACLATGLLAADRISKAMVSTALARTGSAEVIPGIVSFHLTANDGMAFSLGSGLGGFAVALAAAVTIAGVAYLVRAPILSRLEPIGLGMVMGGSIGNAFDRIAHGSVIDFIQTEFMNFPVFNVADIGITLGVLIALVGFVALSPANERTRRESESNSWAPEDGASDAAPGEGT